MKKKRKRKKKKEKVKRKKNKNKKKKKTRESLRDSPASCSLIILRLCDLDDLCEEVDVFVEAKVLDIRLEVLDDLRVMHKGRVLFGDREVTESHHLFARVNHRRSVSSKMEVVKKEF